MTILPDATNSWWIIPRLCKEVIIIVYFWFHFWNVVLLDAAYPSQTTPHIGCSFFQITGKAPGLVTCNYHFRKIRFSFKRLDKIICVFQSLVMVIWVSVCGTNWAHSLQQINFSHKIVCTVVFGVLRVSESNQPFIQSLIYRCDACTLNMFVCSGGRRPPILIHIHHLLPTAGKLILVPTKRASRRHGSLLVGCIYQFECFCGGETH